MSHLPDDDLDQLPERSPRSANEFAFSLVALGLGLVLVWAMSPWRLQYFFTGFVPYLPIIPCIGVATVFALVYWFGAERAVRLTVVRPLVWNRVGIRLCGVAATFALVAVAYWVLPEYHSDFYEPFWQFLRTLAPLAILVPPYLVWADRRFDQEHDEYLEFGTLLLHGRRHVDFAVIRHHVLTWLVKAFFLPLMTVYLSKEVAAFYAALQVPAGTPLHAYEMMFHLSYMTDLLFAVVGYSLTLRLFDSHTRSVEPTVLGWAVALMCYQPFFAAVSHAYLAYEDKTYWDNLFGPWPLVRVCWGTAIVSLTLIYGLSTAAFGMRFSNLTNRGIICDGPYRFSKHPAYLSKNLSWWLISVPWISDQGWTMAIRNCIVLGLVNLIYYARAKTEEQHLSRDPAYVAYALWINEHGLLAPIARRLSFLRYRPADARPGGSARLAASASTPRITQSSSM